MKASIAVIMLVMCLYLSYVQAGRPVPRVLQNRWATAFASSSNSGGSVEVMAWSHGRGDAGVLHAADHEYFDDNDAQASAGAPAAWRRPRRRQPVDEQPFTAEDGQEVDEIFPSIDDDGQQGSSTAEPEQQVDEIPPSTDDDGQQLSSTAGSQQDPEPSGSAQESSVEDADLQYVLDTHNAFRARCGVAPLSWSTRLAASAQRYSQNCVFEHSNIDGVGENLSRGYSGWAPAIRAWMEDEEHLYDHNNPGFSHETGHYTQVLWRKTTELGCGSSPCSGRPLYVCHYAPQGNMLGQFEENVPKPSAW